MPPYVPDEPEIEIPIFGVELNPPVHVHQHQHVQQQPQAQHFINLSNRLVHFLRKQQNKEISMLRLGLILTNVTALLLFSLIVYLAQLPNKLGSDGEVSFARYIIDFLLNGNESNFMDASLFNNETLIDCSKLLSSIGQDNKYVSDSLQYISNIALMAFLIIFWGFINCIICETSFFTKHLRRAERLELESTNYKLCLFISFSILLTLTVCVVHIMLTYPPVDKVAILNAVSFTTVAIFLIFFHHYYIFYKLHVMNFRIFKRLRIGNRNNNNNNNNNAGQPQQ